MILALLWWGLIWLLSSLPSKELPQLHIFSLDKLAHYGVYFILGILLDRWLKSRDISGVRRILVFLAVLISALADEYHQYFIPGRSVSIYDFMANALGLGTAFLMGSIRRDQRSRP